MLFDVYIWIFIKVALDFMNLWRSEVRVLKKLGSWCYDMKLMLLRSIIDQFMCVGCDLKLVVELNWKLEVWSLCRISGPLSSVGLYGYK